RPGRQGDGRDPILPEQFTRRGEAVRARRTVPLGDREQLPLGPRYDVPGGRIPHPGGTPAGECRVVESVRALPAQATSRQGQHRDEAPLLRLERQLPPRSAYRKKGLVDAAPGLTPSEAITAPGSSPAAPGRPGVGGASSTPPACP